MPQRPLLLALTALLAALLCLTACAAPAQKPLVAATVDFLDYAMDDAADDEPFYPLERYEKRLAELAACGIKKIYLRVNACGLTLYPTKVSWQYGAYGNLHFRLPKQSRRLVGTLARWNPLTETIRLCHKYGMEAWAWESVWDDGGADGAGVSEAEASPEWCAQYGHYYLMDPFFRKNYRFYSMRKPDGSQPQGDVAALNRASRGRGIGRIEVVSADKHAPATFTRDELIIAYSQDNVNFSLYDGPCTLTHSSTADGRPVVVLSGLKLDANFVQLMFRTPRPKDGAKCAIIHRKARGQHRIYDLQGEPLPSAWSWANAVDKRGFRVRITDVPAGWDYMDRALGFVVGDVEPAIDDGTYLLGVAEFAIPQVMAHKLARFEELAQYPFDGFMLNLRGHILAHSDTEYGFNPEIREALLKQGAGDIWTDDFDREKWTAYRSDAYDRFLAGCKARANGRPLFVTVTNWQNPGKGYGMCNYLKALKLQWHYDRWFKEGSVDGVTMHADFFPEAFAGKVSNGKPVAVSYLREMIFADPNVTLSDDLERCRAAGLDEIELYEALVITQKAAAQETLRSFTGGK